MSRPAHIIVTSIPLIPLVLLIGQMLPDELVFIIGSDYPWHALLTTWWYLLSCFAFYPAHAVAEALGNANPDGWLYSLLAILWAWSLTALVFWGTQWWRGRFEEPRSAA